MCLTISGQEIGGEEEEEEVAEDIVIIIIIEITEIIILTALKSMGQDIRMMKLSKKDSMIHIQRRI